LGEIFNITGTTNLPTGSEISVTGGAPIHSCPTYETVPLSFLGIRCGHDCILGSYYDKIMIVPGAGGNNT
jgi:hypothetical protein